MHQSVVGLSKRMVNVRLRGVTPSTRATYRASDENEDNNSPNQNEGAPRRNLNWDWVLAMTTLEEGHARSLLQATTNDVANVCDHGELLTR